MNRLIHGLVIALLVAANVSAAAPAASFDLKLRVQEQADGEFRRVTRDAQWNAAETAVIVCDVWDYHHCQNAVRRLEEFAPRLNAVLKEARRRGATIIHSPSDCMDAYTDHPARKRALTAPRAAAMPPDIEHWCSRILAEEEAVYPIDQSDGGEDDDQAEHAAWAEKLKSLGRNPAMPWKAQSPLIEIDDERDYISDRGDEVWSILADRKIKHVILTGVHVNMCVLGRPFGLRQMVRGGKEVVLMRDMTDAMYNPQRWPYVDHFTGTDLVISHIERHVCPTITSDQLLGGESFRSRFDTRDQNDVAAIDGDTPRDWTLVQVPGTETPTNNAPAWYRCAVRLPKTWVAGNDVVLSLAKADGECSAWLNGQPLTAAEGGQEHESQLRIQLESIIQDDANLLVLRVSDGERGGTLSQPPALTAGENRLELSGRWQSRRGDDPSWSNIPLPARFGMPPDVLFAATDDADAVLAVVRAQVDALNGEQLEASLECIDEQSPTLEQTKKLTEFLFEEYDLRITLDDVAIESLDGDEARVRFVQTTKKVAGPEFRENRLEGVHFLKRRDGTWKMYHTKVAKIEFLDE